MESNGYWVTAPPPSGPPARGGLRPPLPPPVLAPPRRRRSRVLVFAPLAAALGLALVGGVVAAQGSPAPDGVVLPVDEPAPLEAGWGPTHVDDRGRPARWDPCQPIPYVVQAGWIPDAGRRDLAEALRRLSVATGLRFVDEGDTDELPSADRSPYQPDRYGKRWAPLLIGWVPLSKTDLELPPDVQGVSIAAVVPAKGGPSIVSGQVVLDAEHRLASGFGPGTTDGEVLLHELAHAVGLGHVLDPTQVMYPQTTNSESVFGAGDRAGLAALGAQSGCHPAPEPRPLRLSS